MFDVSGLTVGTRLRISGDIVAAVIDKVDGEWVRVRLLEVPAAKGGAGVEELCHATDIIEVL